MEKTHRWAQQMGKQVSMAVLGTQPRGGEARVRPLQERACSRTPAWAPSAPLLLRLVLGAGSQGSLDGSLQPAASLALSPSGRLTPCLEEQGRGELGGNGRGREGSVWVPWKRTPRESPVQERVPRDSVKEKGVVGAFRSPCGEAWRERGGAGPWG